MLAIKKSVAATPTLLCWLLLAICVVGCRPSGPRLLLEGERLLHEGNYPAALQKLTEAARRLPTTPQAWNHLGLAYHGARQPKPALEAYQRALALDRNLAVARFNLGCLHLEQNNLPAAIAELTTFTMLSNRSVVGWLKLGSAQLRARQYEAAEKSFTNALKLDARQAEGWNGLGVAQVMRRRPRDAAQSFANALRAQADYAPALLNQAIVMHQYFNDRPAALRKYREYLALQPAPPHAAAVAETVRALEADLSAAARSALTNQVTAAPAVINKPSPHTNLLTRASPTPPAVPPPSSTPPSAAASTPATKPGSVTARSEPPPEQKALPTRAPEPVPQVEVIQLAQEHPVQPPRDEVEVSTPADAPTPEPEPVEPPLPAAIEPTPSAVVSEIPTPKPTVAERPKPGFFQRINPLNLFRTEERSGAAPPPGPKPGRATPLPSAPVQVAAVAPAASPAASTLDTLTGTAPGITPLPGRFTVRRYVYLSPRPPAAGDRRAALTAFARGRHAQQTGRLGEAIAAYEEAVRLDPALFEAHYNLGVAAQEAGELPRALSAYEHALSINPTALNARYNFALALRQAGYPRDAADELEKLLAASPDEARAHFALANLYAQQLYLTQPARVHYQKVLELEPQHPQAAAIRYWLTANP